MFHLMRITDMTPLFYQSPRDARRLIFHRAKRRRPTPRFCAESGKDDADTDAIDSIESYRYQ
jgi:hypothetical protein